MDLNINSDKQAVKFVIAHLVDKIYATAKNNGFHEDDSLHTAIPTKMMLVVSELVEAMEADRKGKDMPADYYDYLMKLGDAEFAKEFEIKIKDSMPDELADVFIRLLDLVGMVMPGRAFADHVIMKMRYNSTRPHMHGGNRY